MEKMVIKQITDTFSSQPDGTLHGYNYFKNSDGKWIYNIDFHVAYGFGSVQIEKENRVPIKKAVNEAHKIFMEKYSMYICMEN